MKANINHLAQAFLEARDALALAELAKKEADRLLKEAMIKADTDTVIVGDQKVRLVDMPGTSYDAETLRDLVSPQVFKKVTKIVVDNAKIQAAIKLGTIDQDVADTANTGNPFSVLRVYDAKDTDKVAASTKKGKVA